jgi:TolA-binding protein
MILLSGCASLGFQSGPGKDFQEASASLQEKKYVAALASYQKILREAPNTGLAADARFGIALVHATPDNPQKDYAQAIQNFEEFIKLHTDNRRAPDARVWIAVLKNVLDLKKENESFRKNIEELKQLDIRHEERRRK